MTARARLPLLACAAALALACASSGGAARSASEPSPAASAGASAPAPSSASTPAPAPAAGPSTRAQRLFKEAVTSLDEQKKLRIPIDWVVLERKFRAAAVEGVPEAWFDVGVSLEGQGKPSEAIPAYETALSLRPGFSEAAVNMAFIEAARSEPREAAARYAELLQKFPEDAYLRIRLAEIYRQAGQLDEAWRLAREALQRDPAAAAAYPVMMRVAIERQNLDLAELIGVRARKLDPGDAEISFLLGAAEERRRDEPAALSLYRKAVSQNPDYLPPRYRLLELALAARSWDGAAEQARAILKANPQDAAVHLALGVALRNQGKVDEALAEYDRALSLSNGALAQVHLARAVAFAKGKNSCEPALPELEAFEAAVGPTRAAETPAPALRRECVQILASAKQAEEAARQMQAEADRKAAEKAAAAKPAPAPSKEGAAPAVPR
ncbi:MAG TPA: adventurous gliding motility TPR repeat lipoprotein GltE [Anaeromyxobacteraceae bacterium]|nr:adventurous gliding motility TPR repeat lipoprotein GltE [Anaeromyxobacteraceae bacterium]